ncbi:hypothetical protein, partial [Klebsiella quasipneumoniae]|uniref:hypothetical protein n=6 Tax=Klebsiella pneumoniae complex TaxID=3390273 RepID=UPI00388F3CB7
VLLVLSFFQSFLSGPTLCFLSPKQNRRGWGFYFYRFFNPVPVLTDLKNLSSVRLTISDNSPTKLGQFFTYGSKALLSDLWCEALPKIEKQ